MISGEWLGPIRGATEVINDVHKVTEMFQVGGVPCDDLCALVLEFVLHLAGEYCLRELPRVHDDPLHAALVFSEDLSPNEVFATMAEDWAIILRAENLANDDPDM